MSLKKVLSKYSRWLWLFLWGICQALGDNKFKVHVIQASAKLGFITQVEVVASQIQDIVSKRWEDLQGETNYCLIDEHTPMWIWSRNHFSVDIE